MGSLPTQRPGAISADNRQRPRGCREAFPGASRGKGTRYCNLEIRAGQVRCENWPAEPQHRGVNLPRRPSKTCDTANPCGRHDTRNSLRQTFFLSHDYWTDVTYSLIAPVLLLFKPFMIFTAMSAVLVQTFWNRTKQINHPAVLFKASVNKEAAPLWGLVYRREDGSSTSDVYQLPQFGVSCGKKVKRCSTRLRPFLFLFVCFYYWLVRVHAKEWMMSKRSRSTVFSFRHNFSSQKNDLFMGFFLWAYDARNVSKCFLISLFCLFCFIFIMRVILVLRFSRATAEGCSRGWCLSAPAYLQRRFCLSVLQGVFLPSDQNVVSQKWGRVLTLTKASVFFFWFFFLSEEKVTQVENSRGELLANWLKMMLETKVYLIWLSVSKIILFFLSFFLICTILAGWPLSKQEASSFHPSRLLASSGTCSTLMWEIL